MIRWLVGTSLRLRFIVIAVAAAMVFVSIDRMRHMPVDVFPEFAPPLVEIQTICQGLTATEVEELVTVPIEEAMGGLDGLDVMRSKSVEQLSAVKLIFKPGTDLLQARQLVQERVDLVTTTLPTWASPPVMLPPLSATSRMMKIGVSSKQHSVIELSMIAYWTIRQALLEVPGVANVAIWGERIQMLVVQVDPKRLSEHGVTLREVEKITADGLDSGLLPWSDGAVVGTGGFVETPNQRLQVRHVLPIMSPDDLGKLVIKEVNGKPVRLADVADVVEDHQPLAGDGVINDDIGLLLIVEKFPWSNTLAVTQGVDRALQQLKPGLPGVVIDQAIFRPATFIEQAIGNLTDSLWLGCALVILILGVFVWQWRIGLITVVAIPLSLLAAVLVLYAMNVTINTMVLAGLVVALGAVVDDAIVDIENVVRRLREHRLSGLPYSFKRVILEASVEVRSAIVFASLIEIAALLPVFFMEGLSGAFFKPLAWTYVIAIGASMLVALTVTPAMACVLLRGVPLEARQSPIIGPLQAFHRLVLAAMVRVPAAAYGILGALFLVGVLIIPQLGESLLPSFRERDFLMHWLTKPGTSLTEEDRVTILASKELREVPGVRNFGAHIGQAMIMDEVVGVYFGENWVSIDPSVPYDETVARIQSVVDGYPGIHRDVQTYLKERIREVLTGSYEAVSIRIFGEDLSVLRQQAEKVEQALKGTPGLKDLHVSLQTMIPEITVKVDLDQARAHGLKPGDVRRAAGVLIAGLEVGDIFRSGKAYDVQVWGVPEARQSITDIQNLLLDTPDGRQVRLADVARVAIEATPNVISRDNMERRIDVGGNVEEGVALGTVAREVAARLKSVDFAPGYFPVLLGEYAERQASERRMYVFSGVAFLIVAVLLHLSFGCWRLAAISLVSLPTALVGGLIAAYLAGGIISLGSLIGFLTVLGISARNGIMMISHFHHLERYEGMAFGRELVLRGARERLSPILMTSLTTGLALLPLVIVGNVAGHEIELPMAQVILGGLVTSTLLNLLVTPVLYLHFGSGSLSQADEAGSEGGAQPVGVT